MTNRQFAVWLVITIVGLVMLFGLAGAVLTSNAMNEGWMEN